MHKFIAALAALTAVSTSVHAEAAALEDRASVEIFVGDLDLGTSRGKRALQQRLSSALDQVCGSYASTETSQHEGITTCRTAARSEATVQIASRARPQRLALKAQR